MFVCYNKGMATKHFFKILIIFIITIVVVLISVFLVSYFDNSSEQSTIINKAIPIIK